MNIGLIGEGYVNFGKTGCIILFVFFGILVAYVEKYLLKFSTYYPIILALVPFYIQVLNGAENDFMMPLNSIL